LAGGETSGSFDPEGGNTPEGEWKLEAQPAESGGNTATGPKRRSGRNRGKPELVVEQRADRAEEPMDSEAKQQARNFDLVMESA
jgi:hypothetical protein